MSLVKTKVIDSEMNEEAMEYMKQWINEEAWDDFKIMYDSGDHELFADALVNAGAIDSDYCYSQYTEIERYIEQLAERFRKLSLRTRNKRYDEAFEGTFVASCKDCNAVSFVHSGNEQLYPELKTECWECGSKNIETYCWTKK